MIGVGSKANIDCEMRPKKDRNHMGSLKTKRYFGREGYRGGDHSYRNRCGSMQVNELKANRSIRAQELSVCCGRMLI